MKTLLVLRHAKSSWKNALLSDHDRPLNKRGKADAPRMGRLLKEEGLTPDLILSSSAVRALSTAEQVALASDYDNELKATRKLYHGWIEAYLELLSQVSDKYERVMVVGHNPGLEELVEELSGQAERMPTAALAQIELPIDSWQALDEDTEGKLVQMWLPKELDR